MRTIKAMPLTVESFREFGEFYSILEPKGHHMGTFFHDHVLVPVSGHAPMAFSAYVVEKPEKMIVKEAEYHNDTSEIILPLDGDIITYVAAPSKELEPENTVAFRIPKGTVVKLNAGVWHKDSFAVEQEQVHTLIVLPERTYKRDCVILPYGEENWIEIEG